MLPRKLTRNLFQGHKKEKGKTLTQTKPPIFVGFKMFVFFGGWWSGRFSCKNELFTSSGTPQKMGIPDPQRGVPYMAPELFTKRWSSLVRDWRRGIGGGPPPKKRCFFVGSKRWMEMGVGVFSFFLVVGTGVGDAKVRDRELFLKAQIFTLRGCFYFSSGHSGLIYHDVIRRHNLNWMRFDVRFHWSGKWSWCSLIYPLNPWCFSSWSTNPSCRDPQIALFFFEYMESTCWYEQFVVVFMQHCHTQPYV